MSEKYDLNEATEEAEEIKRKITMGKADSYTDAHEQLEQGFQKEFENFSRVLNQDNNGDYFLEGPFTLDAGAELGLPIKLEEDITFAVLSHYLKRLRFSYDTFLANPNWETRDGLYSTLSHFIGKIGNSLKRTKIKDFSDVSRDFLECQDIYSKAMKAELAGEQSEDMNSPEFFTQKRDLPENLNKKVQFILNTYSTDNRFNHDPYKLVAEIREDFAKYKAERFPS